MLDYANIAAMLLFGDEYRGVEGTHARTLPTRRAEAISQRSTQLLSLGAHQ